MAEQNGCSRMDRIERALELLIDDHILFREEHKQLLASKVVLTDRLNKLGERVDQLAEQGKHTDDRLNALIAVVDGNVRRQQ